MGILAVVLAGCDRTFGLLEVGYVPPDAPPPNPAGCSDRTREGFGDIDTYPDLAACAGAWLRPGLRDVEPACARLAGNDGSLVSGADCTAADLCALGWHVCQTKLDVAMSQPVTLRSCAGLGAEANRFFATAQSGPGGNCSDNATDDFAGCGTYGLPAMLNCAPLDKTPSNECSAFAGIGGWKCPQFNNEVNTVTKTEPLVGGGVLCCRDR